MWIPLILVLVTSCEYQNILNCLHQGLHNTECVSQEGCVVDKLEATITSYKLRISGFVIDPQFYTQMAAATKCDLTTFSSCFNEDSVKVLDCVTQKFCIEYVSIDHLPDGPEDPEKVENNENVQDLNREEVNNGSENPSGIDKEGLNDGNNEGLIDKLEKIQQEIEELEKELEGGGDKGKDLESNKVNGIGGGTGEMLNSELDYQVEVGASNEDAGNKEQIKGGAVNLVKADTNSCAMDCEQLCDNKKTPESCVTNCIDEFCKSSKFISSDYFSVILTGIVLFLVIFTIFLFIQNKSMRNAIENGDFGIAIYSSI